MTQFRKSAAKLMTYSVTTVFVEHPGKDSGCGKNARNITIVAYQNFIVT